MRGDGFICTIFHRFNIMGGMYVYAATVSNSAGSPPASTSVLRYMPDL